MKFSIDTVILAIELVGVLSFAASGAMTGLRKNMDLFGVCILGLGIFTVMGIQIAYTRVAEPTVFLLVFVGVVTGVGGGVLRDMMAGNTPYIFVKHVYASASLAGALVCVLFWLPGLEVYAMGAGTVTVIVIRILSAYYHWNLPHAHD